MAFGPVWMLERRLRISPCVEVVPAVLVAAMVLLGPHGRRLVFGAWPSGRVGGILSGLTRGPVRLTLLALTKAHMGVSPILNRHKEKDLEGTSRRTRRPSSLRVGLYGHIPCGESFLCNLTSLCVYKEDS